MLRAGMSSLLICQRRYLILTQFAIAAGSRSYGLTIGTVGAASSRDHPAQTERQTQRHVKPGFRSSNQVFF
jgi:hypothetical protein